MVLRTSCRLLTGSKAFEETRNVHRKKVKPKPMKMLKTMIKTERRASDGTPRGGLPVTSRSVFLKSSKVWPSSVQNKIRNERANPIIVIPKSRVVRLIRDSRYGMVVYLMGLLGAVLAWVNGDNVAKSIYGEIPIAANWVLSEFLFIISRKAV